MKKIYEYYKISSYKSYDWITNEGLIDDINNSPISPWYHVCDDEIKWLDDMFPTNKNDMKLLLFARRQDCDDMACFEIIDNKIKKVYVVEGWIDNSYEILNRYDSIWLWLKSVIDDISILAE